MKSDITVTCRECKRSFDISVNPEDVKNWKNGMLIQQAMPYLTADERELLISGTCGECFNMLLSGPNGMK